MTAEPVRHTLYSPSCRRRLPVWTWTPPGNGPFPLLLLLHGVYDADGAGWWTLGRSHEAAAAAARPPVVVMPSDTGAELGSGYCDWADGTTSAETHIVHEVLRWAAAELPVGRERWASGLSMGGYGAVLLSLRHPGLFDSVASTSGFLDPTRLFDFVPDNSDRMWGSTPQLHDPRALLRSGARPARLALDCGIDDDLIVEHRRNARLLQDLGVRHEYAEHPGGHDWNYWHARLPDHLAFHAGA